MKAYQLKITINNSKPPIWRRCIVPAGLSFSQLTLVMHTVMGWCGYHLSEYSFRNMEVALLEEPEDTFMGFSPMMELNASEYLIDEFFDEVKSFTYTYDFGDDWSHRVQIEKVIYDYEHDYPVVLKFKGDTPPEDCGGIWGYYELLDVVDNPQHPEHDEVSEWYESSRNLPYNIDDVNAALAKMKKTSKKIKPISENELYDKFFKGKLRFDQVVVPKDRSGFDEWDYANNELEFPLQDMAIDPIFDGIVLNVYRDVVEALRKNTQMKDEQIKEALDIDDITWKRITKLK